MGASKWILFRAIGKYFFYRHLYSEINKKYFRPLEVDTLLGDSTKARKKLNWKPKFNIHNLVSEMVQSELKIHE